MILKTLKSIRLRKMPERYDLSGIGAAVNNNNVTRLDVTVRAIVMQLIIIFFFFKISLVVIE